MKIYKNKIIVDGVESALAVATDSDVGDGALILKQDGAVIGSFTANQKNDSIINIPTNNLSNATATRSGLMSKEDKSKLDSIEKSANNYVHPKSHPATMITQDQAHKFATAEQLKKVDAIPENPKYTDTTYGLADSVNDGLMAAADKVKLNSIEEGAKNYVHPKTHAAIIITQDETHRFVSDTQIANWNAKADTKENIGLGNVTNDAQVKRSEMGVSGGVATLNENGLVPSSQLPSYVDDVIEVASFNALPKAGEVDKIYVILNTNLTYRWSGTQYVEISASLALGETSSTAYAGDKGKANAEAIASIIDGTTTVAKATDAATVNGLTVLTTVPANAKFTDTIYTHPTTHAATMITTDSTHRFVTDAEKSV